MSPNPSTENETTVANVSELAMREDIRQVEETGMYAKFSSVVLIPIVSCLETFCVAVENTITSTAVARITQDFHSIDDVGWYSASPAFGKIYTLLSSKFVFLASLLIFEIGSLVCATLPTSHVFILGRALAGLGSAGMQAGTTLILAECVPLRQRPTGNSIIGSIFAVRSVAGPLLVFEYFLSFNDLLL
ncbi:hypothetical protein BHYA_0320g00080 [Botrytis hyacinthi]|uniref:Major facilitator superfamily (MFS) profile domain-containing protein n=1 Tax=Botrytis hyacinthi TaxID=278943 RepID=A0A4Z1G5X1_9HELO|nr:hypothetical protein BHYA_0320g00080 [Botrytis hyacinthi]